MEESIEFAERVEKGMPLIPELDQALFHGSPIGGARPKALIQDRGKKYVAKFSSGTDLYSKDVLLIERFDRQPKDGSWSRKAMVSALMLLRLDDMMARYVSYETLAEIIRHRFADPLKTMPVPSSCVYLFKEIVALAVKAHGSGGEHRSRVRRVTSNRPRPFRSAPCQKTSWCR